MNKNLLLTYFTLKIKKYFQNDNNFVNPVSVIKITLEKSKF